MLTCPPNIGTGDIRGADQGKVNNKQFENLRLFIEIIKYSTSFEQPHKFFI
jgi:hypothetical protein